MFSVLSFQDADRRAPKRRSIKPAASIASVGSWCKESSDGKISELQGVRNFYKLDAGKEGVARFFVRKCFLNILFIFKSKLK